MRNYTLYLFDFDYTLVNSESAILKCFHITLKKTGYPDRSDQTICQTIGLPMLDAVKRIIGTNNTQAAIGFTNVYKGEADRYMTAGTHFFPHTVATLQELHRRGARIGIISSKTRHRIQEKFDREQVPHLIDRIIGSDDVAVHKPDPEGIRKALDYFAVPPEAVLYTGDSHIDAAAAQNAGVDFAGVTTGTTTAETLAQYPHIRIMQDIHEILDI